MSNKILGNVIGGAPPLKTLIIADENGTEFVGAIVGEETVLTATDNDVREGSVYAGDSGVSTGNKVIPIYHTHEGIKVVTPDSAFEVSLVSPLNFYDYTKMQAIICSFNTSSSDSVSSEKVLIDDNIYNVNSTEPIATVTKNSDEQSVQFGITNNSDNTYIIRWFTYKEIE